MAAKESSAGHPCHGRMANPATSAMASACAAQAAALELTQALSESQSRTVHLHGRVLIADAYNRRLSHVLETLNEYGRRLESPAAGAEAAAAAAELAQLEKDVTRLLSDLDVSEEGLLALGGNLQDGAPPPRGGAAAVEEALRREHSLSQKPRTTQPQFR